MPHEYNITSTAKYLISVLLLSIILSVSALTVTYFLYRMEIELRDTEMWNFIYDTGCYQDAEPQKLLWFTAISIVFYLLMNLFFSLYFVSLQTIDVTVYQKNECNKKQSTHIADCCRFAGYIKYRHLGLLFFVFKKIEYSSFYNRIKNYQGFCTQNSEKYTI